jgi:hypothetical protein
VQPLIADLGVAIANFAAQEFGRLLLCPGRAEAVLEVVIAPPREFV